MTRSEPGASQLETARAWLVDLAHQHRLSPTQRRVVQHMLDSMPDVAFVSTVDMAEAAGVSQPTVTRIATALGFTGYPEFRRSARTAILSAGGSGDDLPASSTTLSGEALADERRNLSALETTIASEGMAAAAALLAEGRPLGIVGLRVSAALAGYLGYRAQRILPDVHVMTDAATLDDDITQVHLNGGGALVAFVMPRYSDATVRALVRAKQLGMTIIGIVDTPIVPFAELIDIALVAPVGKDLVFDSHAAAIALSIALLDAVSEKDPRRTQARLEAHEERVATWEFRGL